MSLPALLIVDMQVGMSWASSGVRNNPGAEDVMLRILTSWRARRAPIVHIRHRSRTPGSPFWPDQPGAEFQALLAPLNDERVVEKDVPDAILKTGLEKWLRDRDISTVVIVGVSTNNSVESTARTAGNLGFNVYVVADGTFAFAKADFDGRARTAEEVHAMALANLHGEYATVVNSEEALRI
jgi:nicotinamidase-related amidase